MIDRKDFDNWYDGEREKSKPYSTVNIRDKCFEAWKAARKIPVQVHDLADEWALAESKEKE